MKKISLLGSLLAVFISLQPAYSAPAWELDKAHSTVSFKVTHIFSKVYGWFDEFKTDIAFDENSPGESRFNFEIETKSINTNIAKRDKHLQSPDFFDADSFPSMKFESTGVNIGSDGMLEVTGKLTVKGKTYDLVLPLKYEGRKDHPAMKGSEVLGFNGNITLDRLAYGVGTGKFYDMGLVGKDVDVFVSLELLMKK